MAPPLWSATAVARAIRRREMSSEEACRMALERMADGHARLHAFEAVDPERVLARARRLDARAEPAGPLHGVPIAIKDNISTRDFVTTAGSRTLEGYRPVFDATVIERLTRAGAVIVGKTVCDEFAMGSSTEYSASGPTRNPWHPDRTPGGSSGGSAVAVAAGMVPLAIGSDTGGSIRQPAAFCGVAGLKPTYGRVSRYGLIAFASSLDQIGPISREVADLAVAVDVMSGHDRRDSTSAPQPASTTLAALGEDIRGLRVGVPRDLIATGVDPEVTARFEDALDVLKALGVELSTVSLPHHRHAVPVYYLVATAEASSNLARYDGIRYGRRAPDATSVAELYERTRSAGFGPEVKRRLMLGTYVLSAGYYDAYYLKAQQVRTLIRRDFDAALSTTDAVALPTTPTPAFALGERVDDPLQMYLADAFTVSAPLAGLPSLSVPAGFSDQRLPIGLQLVGRAWDEATILRLAHAYERATPWAGEEPPIHT